MSNKLVILPTFSPKQNGGPNSAVRTAMLPTWLKASALNEVKDKISSVQITS